MPKPLDPRTKLLLLVLINVATFSSIPNLFLYSLVLLAAILLTLYGKFKWLLQIAMVFATIIVINHIVFLFPNILKSIWAAFSVAFFVFYPLMLYGALLILTTRVSELGVAMEKLKAPTAVKVSVLVMFRFIPTIARETKSISNAMKLRGLSFGLISLVTKPLKTIECMYVPLLYSLIKTGDELTVASLTRGLGLYKQRSYARDIGFSLFDVIVISVFLLLFALGLHFRGGL